MYPQIKRLHQQRFVRYIGTKITKSPMNGWFKL